MRPNISKQAIAFMLFCLPGAVAFAQTDALTLSGGVTSPGGTVSLPLSIASSTGNSPASIEWTFTYTNSDITLITVSPGAAATSAGKTVACAGSAGSYTCVLAGMNETTIQNGVAAVLTVTLSTSTVSTYIGVSNAMGASATGTTIPVTGTGASITTTLPQVTLTALSCDATTLYAGSSSTCTVTLSAAAPGGGVSVSLSDNSQVLNLPASVTVPASSSTATFTVTAEQSGVSGESTPAVTASLNSTSKSASFTVIICPCSVWSSTAQPVNPASTAKKAIEVGMKFTSDISGYITGVRFFKGSGNGGSHIGNLWSSAGTQLASVTFTNETASGWQVAYFSSPVAITANTTYVISYHAPQGHTATDNGFFTNAGVNSAPLHALADGQNGPDGVYINGSTAFPSTGASATNYWVDAVFNTSPTIGTAAPVSLWAPTATPQNQAASTAQPAQLGMTFLSSVPGYVTGVRFYKSTKNTGKHLGYLWTSTGTLLISVTFTLESASGWQQANFSSPVAINANTPYVISYWSPKGHYADDAGFFGTSGTTSQMLYSPPDGQYGSNGSNNASNAFPTSECGATNYWVDVVFTTAIQ